MKQLAHLIGTVGYVGHMRPAPGTWGSLAALPLGWALATLGGPILFGVALIVGFAKGVWATKIMTMGSDDHDPSIIVIDEVIGQWIALLPVIIGAQAAGADLLALWPGWIAAFTLFRLFDIWKPWLVGIADRRHDHWGVMLDDVIAGIFAAIGVIVLAGLAHAL